MINNHGTRDNRLKQRLGERSHRRQQLIAGVGPSLEQRNFEREEYLRQLNEKRQRPLVPSYQNHNVHQASLEAPPNEHDAPVRQVDAIVAQNRQEYLQREEIWAQKKQAFLAKKAQAKLHHPFATDPGAAKTSEPPQATPYHEQAPHQSQQHQQQHQQTQQPYQPQQQPQVQLYQPQHQQPQVHQFQPLQQYQQPQQQSQPQQLPFQPQPQQVQQYQQQVQRYPQQQQPQVQEQPQYQQQQQPVSTIDSSQTRQHETHTQSPPYPQNAVHAPDSKAEYSQYLKQQMNEKKARERSEKHPHDSTTPTPPAPVHQPGKSSKAEYGQYLQQQMFEKKQREESDKHQVSTTPTPPAPVHQPGKSSKAEYGQYLQQQMLEKKQREESDKHQNRTTSNVTSIEQHVVYSVLKQKQQDYANALQQQIQHKQHQDNKVHTLASIPAPPQPHVGFHPRTVTHPQKEEYGKFLEQQIQAKKRREEQEKQEEFYTPAGSILPGPAANILSVQQLEQQRYRQQYLQPPAPAAYPPSSHQGSSYPPVGEDPRWKERQKQDAYAQALAEHVALRDARRQEEKRQAQREEEQGVFQPKNAPLTTTALPISLPTQPLGLEMTPRGEHRVRPRADLYGQVNAHQIVAERNQKLDMQHFLQQQIEEKARLKREAKELREREELAELRRIETDQARLKAEFEAEEKAKKQKALVLQQQQEAAVEEKKRQHQQQEDERKRCRNDHQVIIPPLQLNTPSSSITPRPASPPLPAQAAVGSAPNAPMHDVHTTPQQSQQQPQPHQQKQQQVQQYQQLKQQPFQSQQQAQQHQPPQQPQGHQFEQYQPQPQQQPFQSQHQTQQYPPQQQQPQPHQSQQYQRQPQTFQPQQQVQQYPPQQQQLQQMPLVVHQPNNKQQSGLSMPGHSIPNPAQEVKLPEPTVAEVTKATLAEFRAELRAELKQQQDQVRAEMQHLVQVSEHQKQPRDRPGSKGNPKGVEALNQVLQEEASVYSAIEECPTTKLQFKELEGSLRCESALIYPSPKRTSRRRSPAKVAKSDNQDLVCESTVVYPSPKSTKRNSPFRQSSPAKFNLLGSSAILHPSPDPAKFNLLGSSSTLHPSPERFRKSTAKSFRKAPTSSMSSPNQEIVNDDDPECTKSNAVFHYETCPSPEEMKVKKSNKKTFRDNQVVEGDALTQMLASVAKPPRHHHHRYEEDHNEQPTYVSTSELTDEIDTLLIRNQHRLKLFDTFYDEELIRGPDQLDVFMDDLRDIRHERCHVEDSLEGHSRWLGPKSRTRSKQ